MNELFWPPARKSEETTAEYDMRLIQASQTWRGNTEIPGRHVDNKWYPKGHSKYEA